MSSPLRIILALPFWPEERQAHDSVIAAACALQREHPAAGLDIVQLAPVAGAVSARRVGDAAHWWEFISPVATAAADSSIVTALLREALGMLGAEQRLILLPAGPQAEEVAAGLAAAVDACALGRCTGLSLRGRTVIGRRPAFGGRLMVELCTDATACATWRPDTAEPAALQAITDSAIRRRHLSAPPPAPPEIELVESVDTQPHLEGADVVVSGGRGMEGPEGFELLARIAECVGAALGGSLPTVDAGWLPVSRQIGQSGKFVAPRLYLAVGISGTPQHLAGVAGNARIVALNKDPDAPIFAVAETGAVGDWRAVLPLLAQKLEELQRAG